MSKINLSKDDEFKESPFGEGEYCFLNACVGHNGGPYDYFDYARGYFKAGHAIAKKVFKESGWNIDILIYPILYNYRHAIELSLKNIINISEDGGPVFGHGLMNLYEKAEEYIKQASSDGEDAAGELLAIIKEFHEVDPTSEVARFPEDKKGVMFLKDMRVINIEPIYHKVIKLELIFDFIDCQIKINQENTD